jgi:hypothetical protein
MRSSSSLAGETRQRVQFWLFSEAGAIAAWAALVLAAATTWMKLIRPQNEVTQAAMLVLGVWWLVGIVVAQLLISPSSDGDRLLEGLAGAGWQAALAVCITGLVVWDTFFVNGEYVNRGLNGGTTALSAWLLGTFLAGLVVIWLRGHRLWRAMMYGAIGTAAGSVWMAVGLTLSLS